MWPPMPLLVISPKHGRVSYMWERKGFYAEKWEIIKVPPYTSILYVDTTMEYISVPLMIQVWCSKYKVR